MDSFVVWTGFLGGGLLGGSPWPEKRKAHALAEGHRSAASEDSYKKGKSSMEKKG